MPRQHSRPHNGVLTAPPAHGKRRPNLLARGPGIFQLEHLLKRRDLRPVEIGQVSISRGAGASAAANSAASSALRAAAAAPGAKIAADPPLSSTAASATNVIFVRVTTPPVVVADAPAAVGFGPATNSPAPPPAAPPHR